MQSVVLIDNLKLMQNFVEFKMEGFIDLIYIDPPFNSNRDYKDKNGKVQFTDKWVNVDLKEEIEELKSTLPKLEEMIGIISPDITYYNYLVSMGIRLYYMRRLLKDTGSIYYHCDPTASHYIKIVMDYVFGIKNFRNEIVWCYDTSGKSKNYYPQKHNIIFLYSKSDNFIFNEQRVSAEGKNASRYNKIDEQGNKYYMRSGKYKVIYQGTIPVKDWWTDISALTNNQNERLGYPTQKPEALLERIIKASSNEGDLVMDFYNGGGTTGAVCKKLNRNYLGCDISADSVELTLKRLEGIK